MQPAFSSAITTAQRARHRCLGLTLQPLRVGHLGLFLEHSCPFPEHPDEATIADLVFAALVCSQKTVKGARQLLSRRWRLSWFMRFWGWTQRKKLIVQENLKFRLYLDEQLDRPLDNGREVAELTAPLYWRLMAMLVIDCHMKPEEALEIPVSFANTLWVTEADRRGSISLLSERQIAFRAWVFDQERQRLQGERN
jgi:hypothetical protein